jgi:hypothetical protein
MGPSLYLPRAKAVRESAVENGEVHLSGPVDGFLKKVYITGIVPGLQGARDAAPDPGPAPYGNGA